MKGKILISAVTLFVVAGIFLGFTSLNDNPKKSLTPESSKSTPKSKTIDMKSKKVFESDNNGGGNQTFGTPYYTDNFDGANDTTALKSRGYKIYRNGGPAGVGAIWFQGNSAVFTAFNGPVTGYVGSNFQSTIGVNNIDNWLVLPKKTVTAGDSIVFYSRSPAASPYPDSIRVMYSAAGDSTVAGPWVELGRFKVNTLGAWERKAFGAAASGANARYAIRYCVALGGPSGNNSDYIGIDALTLEGPVTIANDVQTLSIDSVFNYALPVNTIAPRATFKNVGTANQTAVPVTYKVTGPVNYTNTKNIASILSGASAQVVFDSTFTPSVAGTYNITVFCSLGSDVNRTNDTLTSSFFVVEPNYGGGGAGSGGYFFANSTPEAGTAPSQPSYCWLDTAGSTTLVSNSVAAIPPSTGDLDDGYWTLAGITGSNRIKFMGTLYSDVYVGTNGIISFAAYTPGGGNWYPPAGGLPGGTVRPSFYPAWNDLNWGNATQPINRLSYKIDASKNRLIITYDRAPIFGGDATEWETFQVCLDLVPNNVSSPNSNLTVSHSNTTSVLQTNYLVGLQDATGANFLQYLYIDGSGNFLAVGPLFDTTAGGGVSITFGPDANTLNGPCDKILAMTSNFEACPNVSAVTVELRNSTSPYALVESVSASGGGDVVKSASFSNAANGVAYYVVIKSVNSIETWSSSTVTFTGGSASYDFTTALSQAYGNNQKLVSGVPSIYQGDANQDGIVDLTDITLTYNDASSFITSPSTDYNCDGTTDLTDIVLCFNNSSAFVQLQRP